MRKTIIFFFLILLFSNNAYSSSCESEFLNPPGAVLDPGANNFTNRDIADGLKSSFKTLLEKNLPLAEQAALAKKAGSLDIIEELIRRYTERVMTALLVSPERQDFIVESASRDVGPEIGAYILKGLLNQNPEPHIQEIIAESAGNLGEAGVGVLADMLYGKEVSATMRTAINRSAYRIAEAARIKVLDDLNIR